MLYTEADEMLGALVQTSPPEKRKLTKPALDADLLVFDDLFMTRRIAQESADELQSMVHKRYKPETGVAS